MLCSDPCSLCFLCFCVPGVVSLLQQGPIFQVHELCILFSVVCIDAQHTAGFLLVSTAHLYYPPTSPDTLENRNPTDNPFPMLQTCCFSCAKQSGDSHFLNIVWQLYFP